MTKPPAGKRVLAWDGKQWVRAIWVAKHSEEQFGQNDDDWYDYCESDDTYYWPEGWYEVQTHGGDEMFWHITDGVQEWREMPAAPGAADHVPDAGRMVGRRELAISALKVIYTWAAIDGALVPEHVRAIAGRALGMECQS